jgi:hypothetical protein
MNTDDTDGYREIGGIGKIGKAKSVAADYAGRRRSKKAADRRRQQIEEGSRSKKAKPYCGCMDCYRADEPKWSVMPIMRMH